VRRWCRFVCAIALSLPVLAVAPTAAAQSIAELQYTWFGDTEIASRFRDDRPVRSQRSGLSQLEARAGVPIVLPKGRGVVLPSVQYHGLFPHLEPARNTSRSFHEIGVQLLTRLQLSERWSLVLSLNPVIAGDLLQPSGDDFLLRGVAMPVFDVTDATTLGLGVAYATLLGTEQFVPVLMIHVDPDGAFFLRATLPTSLEVGAALGRIHTGARVRIQGKVFNVSRTAVDDDVLRTSFVTGTAFAALNLRGPLWLDLDVGVTMLRRLAFEQRDDLVGGFDRATGPVIAAGLRITP
jgi:hypothetical protein